jgi:hypothetical protein
VTEIEWLICTDPPRMLSFVKLKASARTQRLFAIACCYGVWDWLPDERSRRGVETAERQADGLASEYELHVARQEAGAANDLLVGKPTYLSEAARAAWYTLLDPESASVPAVVLSSVRFSISEEVDGYHFTEEADATEVRAATYQEYARQLCLLRDIFGNPFRPSRTDAAWLSWNGGTVVQLAQTIYEDHAFDRLPILADALEDAGCGDEDILGHLRGPGPHCRGCWPLDLLLDKE